MSTLDEIRKKRTVEMNISYELKKMDLIAVN